MSASTGDPRDGCYCQNGLTKREYFAAKIMQGFCANPAVFAHNSHHGWGLVNSKESDLIAYADHLAAMMAEASEKGGAL